jgi:hypothetical protein
MPTDYFDYALAIDPNAGVVIPNATAQVYAITDVAFASALDITDVTNVPLVQLKASPTGVFPPFKVVAGDTQVFAVTPAGLVTPLTSVFGSHGAAAEAAAAEAAASAAAAAASAEEATQGGAALPPGGLTGQALVKASPVDGDAIWASISGGGGTTLISYSQIIALPGYPTAFAPTPHTHPVSGISDSSPVGRAVMVAADQQAARAAIGAGTGNGTSNLTLGSASTQAAPGNHSHNASAIAFTPVGSLTATNVQLAIEQASGGGGGGGGTSSVLVWRYGSGAYPTLPATKPVGVEVVVAYGPVAPSSVPGWIGTDPSDALGQYEYMALV